jgi:beta-lactamase superfamily II metal-dependent hydrolase
MYKITFLPARFGDAIWIEYGSKSQPHYVLIDGGTAGTRRQIASALQLTNQPETTLDLLVISHIDRDHIEGILSMLEQGSPGFKAEEVWFNAFHHLPEDPDEVSFSPMQAERLTARLAGLGWSWNQAFDGNAICLPASGALESITLTGGMKITLLSPTSEALVRLRSDWEDEIRQANLRQGLSLPANDEAAAEEEVSFEIPMLPDLEALARMPFQEDTSTANHSSIAFLAEYDGRRVLFAADAPAGGVLSALERLSPGTPVDLDLLKVSHHGSRYTTSLELIQKLNCPRFVISTNGSIFKHPDQEAIARIVAGSRGEAQLFFNYFSPRNEIWNNDELKHRYNYASHYPEHHSPGITIDFDRPIK